MQKLIKKIRSYTGDTYRNMPYGTIYFVSGNNSEVNDWLLANHDYLEDEINHSDDNWIKCSLVHLPADNHYFPKQTKATFYSPMLPTDKTPIGSYSFLTMSLDITEPDLVGSAATEFFSTLQRMCDEILDTGTYKEYHLRQTILSASDNSHIRFSICGRRQDDVLFSISESELLPFTEPSRLEISPKRYQVLLPDYNREIHFTAQVKALYVLFLKHPEGIRMNEIADYKGEYSRLYLCFTNRSDVDRLREGVENLFDVFSPNAMNVKKSQCNSAIRNVIPNEELNRHYIIEAPRGLPHKINLDRSLVTMPENIRSL